MISLHSTGDEQESRQIRLVTADPPSDLPYADFEDFRAKELLKINGFSLTEEALLPVLDDEEEAFQSAAARTLGSLGSAAAIPALEKLAARADDLVKADAAYALTRLGKAEQRDVLKACLNYPVNAYLCPSVAAGYLARLGDPEGFPVIGKCFDVDNLIVRLAACKQLYFFAPFHDTADSDGEPLDVFAQFDRALRDPHTDIHWTALVQLREMWSPEVKSILNAYVASAPNGQLRDAAQRILDKTEK